MSNRTPHMLLYLLRCFCGIGLFLQSTGVRITMNRLINKNKNVCLLFGARLRDKNNIKTNEAVDISRHNIDEGAWAPPQKLRKGINTSRKVKESNTW